MRGRWLVGALLLLGACDDYIRDVPEGDALTGRIDTILAIDGDVTAGGDVFTADCQVCHDETGAADEIGPALTPWLADHDDQATLEVVLGGRGIMPAVDLTDDEAADLIAWLRDTLDK